MPRVIKVIESEVKRGNGIGNSPFRTVKQYHDLNGNLLAEHDPVGKVIRIDLGDEVELDKSIDIE